MKNATGSGPRTGRHSVIRRTPTKIPTSANAGATLRPESPKAPGRGGRRIAQKKKRPSQRSGERIVHHASATATGGPAISILEGRSGASATAAAEPPSRAGISDCRLRRDVIAARGPGKTAPRAPQAGANG